MRAFSDIQAAVAMKVGEEHFEGVTVQKYGDTKRDRVDFGEFNRSSIRPCRPVWGRWANGLKCLKTAPLPFLH